MSNEVVIEVPQGKLKGLKEKTVLGEVFYSYMGIPYAKPPVGDLRFKSPEPWEKWSGTWDATKPGNPAPGMDMLSGTYPDNASEDCLFANVYTKQEPGKPLKKYPVMIWIHGGGFASGSGDRVLYNPDFLLRRDIILVTFNYRLGALGFLSLENCPGNFGLKDQRMLFKWVKQNIASFGGDPDNLTVFGESAGSISIHYHILSNHSTGLFNRVIMESGTSLGGQITENQKAVAVALAKRLGFESTDDAELLAFFKKASPKDLVEKSVLLMDDIQDPRPEEHILSYAFYPTIEPESDDAIISEHPWKLVDSGNFQDVPTIIGVCSRELLGVGVNHETYIPPWQSVEDFQETVPRYFNLEKGSELSLEMARRMQEFYFKDGVGLETLVDCVTDARFHFPTYRVLKAQGTNSKFKSPIYGYVFSYEGGRSLMKIIFKVTDVPGVCHGDEIPYLYSLTGFPPPVAGTVDYDVITKFTDLWADFATTGKPTSQAWSNVGGNSVKYMDMDKEFKTKDGFFKERMDFWSELYALQQKQ